MFTASNSATPYSPQAAPLPGMMRSGMSNYVSPAAEITYESSAGYDMALLVAALEEIEARRAAIEWLLDANLLCACVG